MKYTIYDSTTGMIEGYVSTGDIQHLKHSTYIEGEYDGDIEYILNDEVTSRPLLDSVITISDTSFTADGTSSIIIDSLPECVIVIENLDDELYPIFNEIIDDGELEFSSTNSGTYKITIESFPYQRYIFEVEGV